MLTILVNHCVNIAVLRLGCQFSHFPPKPHSKFPTYDETSESRDCENPERRKKLQTRRTRPRDEYHRAQTTGRGLSLIINDLSIFHRSRNLGCITVLGNSKWRRSFCVVAGDETNWRLQSSKGKTWRKGWFFNPFLGAHNANWCKKVPRSEWIGLERWRTRWGEISLGNYCVQRSNRATSGARWQLPRIRREVFFGSHEEGG